MSKVMDFYPLQKNVGKSLGRSYGQKLLGTTKKVSYDALQTALETMIQKTLVATGDLVGNKIVLANNNTCKYLQRSSQI